MTVTYSLNELNQELTAEQKLMLERAAKMPIVFDEDCPEITPEMAKKAYRPNKNTLKNIV